MFSFISSSLTAASQRFITFELGKGDNGDINNTFSTCLSLHIILALIIAVIAELIGIWFIQNKLLIPPTRLTAAICVFHCSILSMIVMLISVPFNALIVANERMNAFALISVIDAILRLGITYSLLLFGKYDRLIIYGLLMFLAQLIVQSCYAGYCKKTFKNISYTKSIDKPLMKKMGNFALWSIFGNLAFMTYTQGLNLLLGTFFSPVVNAARGLAVQVQSAVNSFVNSFQTAINPQITKSYASDNKKEMIRLIFLSSRFSFFLLMILSIPVLLRTSDILNIWLVDVPEYTTTFVRIILLTTWINSIANPLIISVKATGKIRLYEATVGSLMIAILPISYIFLRLGYRPETVFIVHLVIEVIAMAFRIWNAHSLIHFSYREYFHDVIIRIVVVAIISFTVSYICSRNLPEGIMPTVSVVILSLIVSFVTIFTLGMKKNERLFIINKIKR